MKIENTTFGTITIDGKTYEHDVLIRLSGEVVKRKKKLSKKYYGTSHVLSKVEAKFVFERDATSSLLARAKWAMSACRRKQKRISKGKTAKSCCGRPPMRSRCSTSHMLRRSGFFTLLAETEGYGRDCTIVNKADCTSLSSLGSCASQQFSPLMSQKGQSPPKRDVRVASVYSAISDIILQRSERRAGP
jgi:hypothetical protein